MAAEKPLRACPSCGHSSCTCTTSRTCSPPSTSTRTSRSCQAGVDCRAERARRARQTSRRNGSRRKGVQPGQSRPKHRGASRWGPSRWNTRRCCCAAQASPGVQARGGNADAPLRVLGDAVARLALGLAAVALGAGARVGRALQNRWRVRREGPRRKWRRSVSDSSVLRTLSVPLALASAHGRMCASKSCRTATAPQEDTHVARADRGAVAARCRPAVSSLALGRAVEESQRTKWSSC